MRRRKVIRGRYNRRLFSRTASRVHKRNLRATVARGGIRL